MSLPAATRGPKSDAAHHQALRFLLVGSTTVAIDYVVYNGLHWLGLAIPVAKTLSFVVATICAYLLNRHFTFGATGGREVVARFVVLYAVALGVNVGVNELALAALPESALRMTIAFLCAQAVSSTLNFLGMRYVVFTDRPGAREETA